ncbi:MAG TPA: hypothetical protein VLH81_00760, partial [Desulfobacterales bacterium]|nr:hypothetical protein [Desulfobacterales bacterium]
ALLSAAEIPYMIVGSLASSYHGRPRATQDIDVVVEADAQRVSRFVGECVDRGFYVDLPDALQAVAQGTMFNVIDPTSGNKLDVIMRKDRSFSRGEFERRSLVDVPGGVAVIATPEDVILAKLEWGRASGSDRHHRDALGIAQVQGASLDAAYLRRWASVLGVADDVERLLREAGIDTAPEDPGTTS